MTEMQKACQEAAEAGVQAAEKATDRELRAQQERNNRFVNSSAESEPQESSASLSGQDT